MKPLVYSFPLPPSVNTLYFNNGHGRSLSTEGRAYKARVIGAIVSSAQTHQFPDDPALKGLKRLGLEISLYLEEVENAGWPGKAKSRYKRVDASNRVKVLEDAVSEALGLDDSCFFQVTVRRGRAPDGKQYCVVRVFELEDNDGGRSSDQIRTDPGV